MKYATKEPIGGQRVSLGRVVLVCRLKGEDTSIEPAMVIRIHEDERVDVRSMADMQEVFAFRFAHVGHEDDLVFMQAGQWCWPPRAA